MPKVFAKARVLDVERWKQAFMRGDEIRRAAGLTVTAVHRGAERGEVIVEMDARDPGALMSLLGSEDSRARMADAGVIGSPEVWIATAELELDTPDASTRREPLVS